MSDTNTPRKGREGGRGFHTRANELRPVDRNALFLGANVYCETYGVGTVKTIRTDADDNTYYIVNFLDYNVPQMYSVRGEWVLGKASPGYDVEVIAYNANRVMMDRFTRDAVAFVLGMASALAYIVGLH